MDFFIYEEDENIIMELFFGWNDGASASRSSLQARLMQCSGAQPKVTSHNPSKKGGNGGGDEGGVRGRARTSKFRCYSGELGEVIQLPLNWIYCHRRTSKEVQERQYIYSS